MRRSWCWCLVLAALAALFSGCSPAQTAKGDTYSGPGAAPADRAAGAKIFSNNCATCHGATGVEGGSVGPSLRRENERMDYSTLVSWIKDPAPPMPHLYPKVLTTREVEDVAAYVSTL